MPAEFSERLPGQDERLRRLYHATLMRASMVQVGNALEASDPSTEEVFQGAFDTGTIQTSADLDVSSALLSVARDKFPGSFSEEDDPQDEEGYIRLRSEYTQEGLWMVDPVDGTGDRKFGEIGSPERRGYSILSTFVKNGEVEESIVVRPAYRQVLGFHEGKIVLAQEVTPQTRASVRDRTVSPDNTIRINFRGAYPQVSFPSDFWEVAYRNTGYQFVYERCGGAGDSLSKLVLGEVDLVVARKGDWKAWDTGPFDPMLRVLGGKITDCDNNPLGGYLQEDLWHHRGVIASVDRQDAHDAFVVAMEAYKNERGEDLVIETPVK